MKRQVREQHPAKRRKCEEGEGGGGQECSSNATPAQAASAEPAVVESNAQIVAAVAKDDLPETTLPFRIWLHRHGAECSSVCFKDVGGAGGRGVVATSAIRKGDVVLSVPRSLLLTEEHCMSSNIVGAIDRAFQDGTLRRENTQVTRRTVVMLVLIQARWDKNSKWHPLAEAMPKVYDTPLWWTAAQLNLLRGTVVGEREVDRKSEIRATYDSLFPNLSNNYPEIFPPAWFTWESYRWAFTSFHSRCFPESIGIEGAEDAEFEAWKKSGQGLSPSAIVPLFDMLNHRVGQEVHFARDESGKHVQLRASSDISEGEEMFINYGNKPNGQLLMAYGFILPQNTYEYVAVPLPLWRCAGCTNEDKSRLLNHLGLLNKKTWIVSRQHLEKNLLQLHSTASSYMRTARICAFTNGLSLPKGGVSTEQAINQCGEESLKMLMAVINSGLSFEIEVDVLCMLTREFHKAIKELQVGESASTCQNEEDRRRYAIAFSYKEQQLQLFQSIFLLAKEHWCNCLRRLRRSKDGPESIEQKIAFLNEICEVDESVIK